MSHSSRRLALRQAVVVNLLVAAAYYILAELSRCLASTPNDVTPVWPPDAIAVAVALLYGRSVLPGVGLGSFLANIWAFWQPNSGVTLLLSALSVLGIAAGTTLGTWLGTGLLRRSLQQEHPFERVGNTVRFLVYAGCIGPIVNATFGVSVLAFQQAISWQDCGSAWMTWWISNVAGILILSPVLLSLEDGDRQLSGILLPLQGEPRLHRKGQAIRASWLEIIGLTGLIVTVAQVSFWGNQSLAYMLVPLLIWAAFRLNFLGATLAVLLTASIAILGTVRGRGTFAVADLNSSLIALQSFIVVIAFTVLILLAVLTERRTANAQLQAAIQELKVANSALAEQTVQLGNAARLKDEFLAMVSHELRTPLIGILGMSDILAEGMLGELNIEQLDAIQKVDSSGQHLLSLINELLDLSSIETGQLKIVKKPTSIEGLCHASLDMVAPLAAQKQIYLGRHIAEDIGKFNVDAKRLQQVFTNLLGNAIKFTPEGGEIHFYARYSLERDRLLCSVEDTGIGVSESSMEHIFDRFFQVNNKLNRPQEGLGLGLAIAKQLVDLHQGSIQVSSKPGQGSCFTVELPYLPPRSIQLASAQPHEQDRASAIQSQ